MQWSLRRLSHAVAIFHASAADADADDDAAAADAAVSGGRCCRGTRANADGASHEGEEVALGKSEV